MKYKDYGPYTQDVFKDVDKVFKEMEKVFNQIDKRMEEALASANESYKAPWEPWFAWRPVKIKGNRVWLKKVYRRKTNTYVNYDDWSRYEYGDMFDVLKEAGEK